MCCVFRLCEGGQTNNPPPPPINDDFDWTGNIWVTRTHLSLLVSPFPFEQAQHQQPLITQRNATQCSAMQCSATRAEKGTVSSSLLLLILLYIIKRRRELASRYRDELGGRMMMKKELLLTRTVATSILSSFCHKRRRSLYYGRRRPIGFPFDCATVCVCVFFLSSPFFSLFPTKKKVFGSSHRLVNNPSICHTFTTSTIIKHLHYTLPPFFFFFFFYYLSSSQFKTPQTTSTMTTSIDRQKREEMRGTLCFKDVSPLPASFH